MRSLFLFGLLVFVCLAPAQTRIRDVIYLKEGGTAFTMDVLKPTKPNRAGVVFLVSGGWISDHSMLNSFMPDIEKVFIDEGFTVFEVLHGAQPRYKVGEIVEQVRTATRFVHRHAAEYGVDPDRIGVSGISSGGHLALMIGGASEGSVKAVAAIAPPTDLANWGKPGLALTDVPQMAMFVPALGFDSKTATQEFLTKLSPIGLVSQNYPATLVVHGDADQVVPLQQARSLDQALGKAGVEHRLEVVSGGGHDEKTFGIGLAVAVRWFRDHLLKG